MLPMRTFARAGSRAMPFLATRVSAIARPAVIRAAVVTPRTCAFRTSALLQTPAESGNDVSKDLCLKLESELEHEESDRGSTVPDSITEYLANSPFKIDDTPGKEEVTLTRQFGNEKITVCFSTASLEPFDNESEPFDDEEGMVDEEERGSKSDSQRQGERSVERDTDADSDPFDEAPDTMCRLQVVIEKPGKTKGALNIEASATDQGLMIDSVYYYKDAKMAHAMTSQDEFASHEVYPGPAFNTLDSDLQDMFQNFLEERDINEALGAFAAEYIDYKEQREYMTWLSEVKQFVSA